MASDDQSKNDKREHFLNQILSLESEKQTHFSGMTMETYARLVGEVEEAKSTLKKTPLHYRRLKRFDVLDFCGEKRLVSASDPAKHYLPAEEIYDVIETVHAATGHGGRDKIKSETSKTYANVTTEMINLFLSMCELCLRKKGKKRKCPTPRPVAQTEIFSRCQVDIVDMQSQPDDVFNFVMVYEDHSTKFMLLRPLRTATPEEVASQLVEIFLTFGAPSIIHSQNGREFVKSIITELKTSWPEIKLVSGKPHPEFEERSNQRIKNTIETWMQENLTSKWTKGLPFVQFTKNRELNEEISQSPFKAMFGTEPRVGLVTSGLSSEVLQNVEDEEDLEEMLVEGNKQSDEKGTPYFSISDLPLSIKCDYTEDHWPSWTKKGKFKLTQSSAEDMKYEPPDAVSSSVE